MSTKRPLDTPLTFKDALDILFRGVVEVRDPKHARRGASRRRFRRPPKLIPCGPGYDARFGLARLPPPPLAEEEDEFHGEGPTRASSTEATTKEAVDDDRFFDLEPVLRDRVVPFLAPHELLRLLRCSKGLWGLLGGDVRERRNAILESVFSYLRVSEECAANVASSVPGGWRAFSPVLVGLCADMARTYGHLEPDPAHRAIVAEQACFSFGKRRYRGLGRLATWDMVEHERAKAARGLMGPHWQSVEELSVDDEDNDDDDDESGDTPGPPSLLTDKLRKVGAGKVCWGDPGSCLVRDDERFGEWMERNRKWMQEHASEEPNEQVRLRLEKGLHPMIWIMYQPEMYIEYALAVGKTRKQSVVSFSSFYDSFQSSDCAADNQTREDRTETFYMSFDADGPSGGQSFVRFLIDYACPAESSLDPSPTKSMAVWCLRHGLEPFASNKSIDWAEVFKDEDPFLLDALTSPVFGPADVEKYKERRFDCSNKQGKR